MVWLIAGGAKRLLSVWFKPLNCSWHAAFQWSKIAARSGFILLYRLCGTINVGVLWEQTGWTLLIWTKGSLKLQLFETNSFWSCLCSAHWVFVWFIFLTGLSSNLHKEPKCERRKGAKDLFVCFCFCFGIFGLFIWGGKKVWNASNHVISKLYVAFFRRRSMGKELNLQRIWRWKTQSQQKVVTPRWHTRDFHVEWVGFVPLMTQRLTTGVSEDPGDSTWFFELFS